MPNFKIVVMGDINAGKRTLIDRLVGKPYEESLSIFSPPTPTALTQGADTFTFINGHVNNESRWGRGQNETRAKSNFQNCKAIIFALDPLSNDSVSNFESYIEMARASSMDHINILVVITKSDITQNDAAAQKRIDQIKNLSKEHYLPCVEASAKTNDKIPLIKDWTVNVAKGLSFEIEDTHAPANKSSPKTGGCSIS